MQNDKIIKQNQNSPHCFRDPFKPHFVGPLIPGTTHHGHPFKCRMSNLGCRMSDVGCRISDVGCQMSDVESRMSDQSDVKSGMSDVECWISNLGCPMSELGCGMAPISFRKLRSSHGWTILKKIKTD